MPSPNNPFRVGTGSITPPTTPLTTPVTTDRSGGSVSLDANIAGSGLDRRASVSGSMTSAPRAALMGSNNPFVKFNPSEIGAQAFGANDHGATAQYAPQGRGLAATMQQFGNPAAGPAPGASRGFLNTMQAIAQGAMGGGLQGAGNQISQNGAQHQYQASMNNYNNQFPPTPPATPPLGHPQMGGHGGYFGAPHGLQPMGGPQMGHPGFGMPGMPGGPNMPGSFPQTGDPVMDQLNAVQSTLQQGQIQNAQMNETISGINAAAIADKAKQTTVAGMMANLSKASETIAAIAKSVGEAINKILG